MNKLLVVVILIITLLFIPIVPYDFKLGSGATELRYKSVVTMVYEHQQKSK